MCCASSFEDMLSPRSCVDGIRGTQTYKHLKVRPQLLLSARVRKFPLKNLKKKKCVTPEAAPHHLNHFPSLNGSLSALSCKGRFHRNMCQRPTGMQEMHSPILKFECSCEKNEGNHHRVSSPCVQCTCLFLVRLSQLFMFSDNDITLKPNVWSCSLSWFLWLMYCSFSSHSENYGTCQITRCQESER